MGLFLQIYLLPTDSHISLQRESANLEHRPCCKREMRISLYCPVAPFYMLLCDNFHTKIGGIEKISVAISHLLEILQKCYLFILV